MEGALGEHVECSVWRPFISLRCTRSCSKNTGRDLHEFVFAPLLSHFGIHELEFSYDDAYAYEQINAFLRAGTRFSDDELMETVEGRITKAGDVYILTMVDELCMESEKMSWIRKSRVEKMKWEKWVIFPVRFNAQETILFGFLKGTQLTGEIPTGETGSCKCLEGDKL